MDAPNTCTACDTTVDAEDNYCRGCGAPLALIGDVLPPEVTIEETRAITRPATRSVARRQSSVPAPVARAAAAVAIGTALQVGASLAGKYLMRRAANAALESVTPARVQRRQPVARRDRKDEVDESGPRGVVAVTETVVFQRVWLRRD